jgi:hypothetical protein
MSSQRRVYMIFGEEKNKIGSLEYFSYNRETLLVYTDSLT